MMKKKYILAIIILLLTVIGLLVGLYLSQRKQELRTKAAPAATIYLQPSQVSGFKGETLNFDILVDAVENYLATVRLNIIYDESALEGVSLTFNSDILGRILREVNLSVPGSITGSAGVEPGAVLTGAGQKIGAVSFRVISPTEMTTTINFAADTNAYSASPEEPIGLDQIVSRLPAEITILMPSPTPSPSPSPSPLPDLLVNSLVPLMSAADSLKIDYQLSNQGEADATATKTYFYIDGEYKFYDDDPEIPAGQSAPLLFYYGWSCLGESHQMQLCADGAETVPESDEENNCLSATLVCSSPTPSPSPEPQFADLDGDGMVNEVDYALLLVHFDETGEPGKVTGDLNEDGLVNEIDYAALIAHFGEGEPE